MRLLLLTFWACLPLWLAAENKDLSNIPEANTASLAATLQQVATSPERAPLSGVVERIYPNRRTNDATWARTLEPNDLF